MRWVTVACLVAVARAAHAAPPEPSPPSASSADELQEQGEKAARDGDYAGAIDKFKAADRLRPSAVHACLIALAYTRRNLWPQAEVFRSLCHERATATDALPPWVATADKQIDAALAVADVAPVTIVSNPRNAGARLTVSSFAQDESFPPRLIHLPPGRHEIFATAPGYAETRVLVVVTDRSPQTVAIQLHAWGDVAAVQAPPAARPSPIPWIVIGAGAVVGLVGGLLEATWYSDAYNKVQGDVPTSPAVATDLATWRTRRDVVVGSYFLGGAAVIAGVALKYTVFREQPVYVAPAPGGATVGMTWTLR
jgi:hypothetical protein